jgi:polyhydroxyalkanoate synthesis regulator phasin
MIDLIKRAMFTGIGIASLTKDKVEEIAKEFVEKGKISEQEGKKLVDELLARSDESKEMIRQQVDERIQLAFQKMNIARSSEIEELKQQIKELHAALEKNGRNGEIKGGI